MIIKAIKIPKIVEHLRILDRWLPDTHSKKTRMKKDLADRLSGYYGEREIDYYLETFPKSEFHLYHDLRLPKENGKTFQMDVTIVFPQFILIVEVKNWTGEIICDTTFNQLIRKYENHVIRYKDPLAQVTIQRSHLTQLLNRYKIPSIPIEHLVIFTHKNCILSIDNKDHPFTRYFLLVEHLTDRIRTLQEKYKRTTLTSKDLNSLKKLWLKLHTPENIDVLKEYKISVSELCPGVTCSICGHSPMNHKKGGWICGICGHYSKDAHVPKIEEYFQFIKPTITNKECREILCISSPDIARRKLISMDLQSSGSNKDRIYYRK